MKRSNLRGDCRFVLRAAVTALVWLQLAAVDAGTLRMVTYNIEADIGGYTTARPGFTTVIVGIGDEVVNGISQPVDVLSLQETTSNTTTVDPIVVALNTIYGAGTYARSPYQATQNGSASTGNGPNALVYNVTTVQLIASVGVGTPSSSGAPRQPVRYQFRPVGGTAVNDFYVYVSHAKAGTTSSDLNRRNIEAQLIRTDEATLPATARVIYTGDLNLGSSSEASYQTLTAAGNGQAFDPLNRPGNWQLNSAFQDILTESSTDLRYRDDFQLVTQNILSDPNGLVYIAGSYHTFGINGTVAIHGAVTDASNTALTGLPNRAAVLSALTTASDHLPVVADYEVDLGGTMPAVTGQPGNQTVCSGGSTSFTVTATGSPAPTYQWREGTGNLTNGGNISGATTATLTINPVGTGDAATNYNCVVTNANGSATSNNASLTVNSGAALTAQPGNQAICSGGSASFSVTASGSPAPTCQWRKGTTNLTNGGNISGATTTTLTINPASAGDAATTYNCVVTNSCGTATSNNASLTVNAGAAITGQPGDQTVCTGGSVSFTVTASGSPTYQWRKGTTNLTNGGTVSGATTPTLTINPAGTGDAAANYNCVVTNPCGSAASNSAALTVTTGAAVTGQPGDQTVCAGGSASFSVTANGSPGPTYQWRRGTTNLSDGGSLSGATTATLTINPTSGSDAAGSYNCVVTNSCGSATSDNASLTVNVGPSIATPPQGQALVPGSAAVFSVVASGSPPPSYQWRKNSVPLADGGSVSGAGTATLTINPVAAGDAGHYDVVLTNICDAVTSAPAPFWRRGDLNCDGTVNYADINAFVQALGSQSAYESAYPSCNWLNADCDGDGQVNYADINPFINMLSGS